MYRIIYFQSYISIMMRLLSIVVFITISDWSHGRFNSMFCANKACKSHKAPMALARHRNILTAYKKTIIRSFLCHLTAKSITDTERWPLIRTPIPISCPENSLHHPTLTINPWPPLLVFLNKQVKGVCMYR